MLELQFGNQSVFEKVSLENEEIIANSLAMKTVVNEMVWINKSYLPTLIIGKSGSGKDLIARELFRTHSNKTHSFLKINVRTLSEKDVDDNLFNGRENPIKGFLEKYTGNTLFIKGFENLDFSTQLKLLRVLKSPDYKELEKSLEIRIICTAHTSLLDKIREGQFYEELFNQFRRHLLYIPDLRERVQDIPQLFHYYLSKNNFKGIVDLAVFDTLKHYSWKGNVTELKNLCERLAVASFGQESIRVSDLPLSIREFGELPLSVKYNPTINLEKLKNLYIRLAVEHFQCKKRAAKALGISVKTIYNKKMEGILV